MKMPVTRPDGALRKDDRVVAVGESIKQTIGNQCAIPFMEMPVPAMGNVINGDASEADKQKVILLHRITTITV